MSKESINYNENKNVSILMNPKTGKKNSSGRVDINVLINRIRLEKQKENKINLVFFGLIMSLVVVVGIILSF
jgi:hypothetical protein|tara:strand:+ start:964 stop:1179 length:216 start_codon:yes stop_codon:yes gene_type:complete